MLESLNSNKLEYQRLSKEEMQQRGILGRLVGPCADFINPTRNGRGYSERLWENVFNNPIMKERIENKVCYGELGHPLDREETDIEKIAVCLAETPKKGKDGKLRAVFDILDTPNGKLLKALCDYGSTLGVSSRGSGDLDTDWDGNESVNPDTYNCEGFDIVLIPAVKEARLEYVTESLNKTRYNKTLKDKLVESIDKENAENQKVMKESLSTLGINLSEDVDKDKQLDIINNTNPMQDDIHTGIRNTDDIMTWEEVLADTDNLITTPDWTEEDMIEADNSGKIHIYSSYPIEQGVFVTPSKMTAVEYAGGDASAIYDKIVNVDDVAWIASDEGQYTGPIINEDITLETDNNINVNSEAELKKDAANNDGALVEELQKALNLNKKLDEKIVNLQEKLSVSYAKEIGLKEEIDRHKTTISKLSNLSKEIKSLNEQLTTEKTNNENISNTNKTLNESISDKDSKIKQLSESVEKQTHKITAIREEANDKIGKLNDRVKSLKENLNTKEHDLESLQEKYDTLNKDYTQSKNHYSKRLEQQNKLIEKYQSIAVKSVDRYIESQAVRLGVKSAEIKNRLPESYSFSDIDSICEDLQTYKVNMSTLPFNTDDGSRLLEGMKLKAKNVDQRTLVPVEEDIDDFTLALAQSFYTK